MILKTQLTVYGRKNLDFEYTKAGLKHDAMIAHALVFAMGQMNSDGALEKVFDQASKLLEEWGVSE